VELSTPIQFIKGVGEKSSKLYARLGIETVEDLIYHFPRRYDDYSKVVKIKSIRPGAVTLRVKVVSLNARYVRRGLHITEAVVADDSGQQKIVWFNQPYRKAAIKSGVDYFVSGLYDLSGDRYQIVNPSMELVSAFPKNTARIVPIYPETKGLKSHQIRKAISQVLPLIEQIPESLPGGVVAKASVMRLSEALANLHFPASNQSLDAAQDRLGFEELYEITLAGLLNKRDLDLQQGLRVKFQAKLAKDFVASLDFKLTDAQRKAAWQVLQDLTGLSRVDGAQGAAEQWSKPYNRYGERVAEAGTQRSATSHGRVAGSAGKQVVAPSQARPMNRLLEGDVGSGKTVVAAMAVLMAAEAGYQTAYMAPTEILARQQYEELGRMLGQFGVKTELFIGALNAKRKMEIGKSIESGVADLVVGTHALIQKHPKFKHLALAVIDEQHRFGVGQREKLLGKAAKAPHVLTMTATPIPRTLSLTLYGELDVSLIDELPPGRRPVETTIVSPANRGQVYADIDAQLAAGRQAYVICPLVDDSDTLGVKSVTQEAERLDAGPFKNRRVALMHGRLKPAQKETIMREFADGQHDILVSTTVVEVGVNVPNATLMLVEGAERFGLAQLHQLRGRIRRSEHKPYFFMMTSEVMAPPRRLRYVAGTDDGFKLAELDLKLRGPGEIYGRRQHGELELKLAKLTDIKQVNRARQAAQASLDNGLDLLQYPRLSARVNNLRKITNLN